MSTESLRLNQVLAQGDEGYDSGEIDKVVLHIRGVNAIVSKVVGLAFHTAYAYDSETGKRSATGDREEREIYAILLSLALGVPLERVEEEPQEI